MASTFNFHVTIVETCVNPPSVPLHNKIYSKSDLRLFIKSTDTLTTKTVYKNTIFEVKEFRRLFLQTFGIRFCS